MGWPCLSNKHTGSIAALFLSERSPVQVVLTTGCNSQFVDPFTYSKLRVESGGA